MELFTKTVNNLKLLKTVIAKRPTLGVWQGSKHASSFVKGALSSLKQVLATEVPLKVMKNAFYFTLRALLVLKIFKFQN